MNMYKFFTSKQLKNIDARATKRLGDSHLLMENAGLEAFKIIKKENEQLHQKNIDENVLVICGIGNNAGDGFVLAKNLLAEKIKVTVLLVGDASSLKSPALEMYKSIKNATVIKNCHKIQWKDYSIIVDALFGIGLDKDITGGHASIIQQANNAKALKIALDIPSGVHADTGCIMGVAFQTDITISFFSPKLGQYLMPGKFSCGKIVLADIGIIPSDYVDENCDYFLNHSSCWQDLLNTEIINQHKYQRGHALIIGGDTDAVGASKLASLAALRAGSGLVSIACNLKSLPIYASWVTAIMTKLYRSDNEFTDLINHPKISVLVHGMGAGVTAETKKRTIEILKTKKPCVIDADAICCFKDEFSELQKHLHTKVVLTPHTKEFERLFSYVVSMKKGRLVMALEAAKISGCTIVLKGNDTIVASPLGKAFINYTAPAHLATAGSGDVLSGIIGAQIGKTDKIFEATAKAVWMHSQAANCYKSGMIADDIISALLLPEDY